MKERLVNPDPLGFEYQFNTATVPLPPVAQIPRVVVVGSLTIISCPLIRDHGDGREPTTLSVAHDRVCLASNNFIFRLVFFN